MESMLLMVAMTVRTRPEIPGRIPALIQALIPEATAGTRDMTTVRLARVAGA